MTADGRLINGGEGEEIGSLYRARIGKPEGNGEPEMHDAKDWSIALFYPLNAVTVVRPGA